MTKKNKLTEEEIYKNLPTLWAEIKAVNNQLVDEPEDDYLNQCAKNLQKTLKQIETLLENRLKEKQEEMREDLKQMRNLSITKARIVLTENHLEDEILYAGLVSTNRAIDELLSKYKS